jgi:hypothetical protein
MRRTWIDISTNRVLRRISGSERERHRRMDNNI